ncbi:unnamed protein product [Psylliodes chrysocephalus]|uniref:Mutator-like transposase domain-containing protein n=1 Tax=Psylliodes chrysocephalus TaxID=3402493 RepID=A0A9P0GH89_9CUCU|nr:unnamed protein product [Psylliodes chrysocephala]
MITKVGKPRKRMKWTNEINSFIMRSYYEITKLENDLTVYRYALHRAFTEKYPDLQHLTEQRIADQRRTIIKNTLIPLPALQQVGSIPHALEHKINPVLADEHLRSLNDTVIVQFEPQTGCSRNYETSDKEKKFPLEQKTISDDFVLTGRRIVDILFLFKQIVDEKSTGLFGCDITDMEVINEVRKGFMSTFTFKCKMCGITKQIYSEDPKNFSGTTDSIDINSALTLGAVSTGIGYSTFAKIAAAINMPMIAEKTYVHYHEKVADAIYSTATQVMEEAGREEAELAKRLGEVDGNGIPFITVVADGAWSKRSYNVNYNASSGVGCIVGYRTGKLLYVKVRNKFCSICDFYNRKQKYRNINVLKTGPKLMETKPYGPQTAISKIECRNHLLRYFSSLVKKPRSVSTNSSVPVYLRKEVEKNSKRLKFAISKATKYRIEENTDFKKKVELLKRDILNASSHVFGEHAECEAINYFKCDRKGTNFVALMK